MAGDVKTFPPGDLSTQIPGLVPIRQGVTKFTRVVGVSELAGDAEFTLADSTTPIQDANDAIASSVNLALGKLAQIKVGPGLFLEDVILDPGVSIEGAGVGATFIGGSASAATDLLTLDYFCSVSGVSFIASQNTKRSAINLVTAASAPLLADVRNITNCWMETGITQVITTGVRTVATVVGVPLFCVSDSTILAATNFLDYDSAAAADITISNCRIPNNTNLQIDGTGMVTVIGSYSNAGLVIINTTNSFRPIAFRHGTVSGTAGVATGYVNDLADLDQFVIQRDVVGGGFDDTAQPIRARDAVVSLVNRITRSFSHPGNLSTGIFLAGDNTPSFTDLGEQEYSKFDVKLITAPTGSPMIISFAHPTLATKTLSIPAGTNWATELTLVGGGFITTDISVEVTQVGSTIAGGDIEIIAHADAS